MLNGVDAGENVTKVAGDVKLDVSVGGVYFDGQPLYGSGITEFELALEDNQSHTLTIYYVAGK